MTTINVGGCYGRQVNDIYSQPRCVEDLGDEADQVLQSIELNEKNK